MAYADLDDIARRTDAALQGVETASTALLANTLVEAYNDLEQDLLRRYQEEPQGGLFTQQRALAIMQDIQFSLRMIAPLQAEELEAQFASLLNDGSEIGHAMASDMMAAITAREADEFTGADMPVEAIAAQARDGLERLSGHTQAFAGRATAAVQQGLIQGWSPRRLTNVIQTELGTTEYEAERIARTETLSAHNSAALQRYTDNGVEYWQRIPVLDSRVCRYCQARAFNVYKTEDNAAVLLHPMDRCVAVPYDPEWAEDGLINKAEMKRWRQDMQEKAEEEPAAQSDLAPFEKGSDAPPKPALTGSQVISGKRLPVEEPTPTPEPEPEPEPVVEPEPEPTPEPEPPPPPTPEPEPEPEPIPEPEPEEEDEEPGVLSADKLARIRARLQAEIAERGDPIDALDFTNYKPTMTDEEAEAFFSESEFGEPLYHGTNTRKAGSLIGTGVDVSRNKEAALGKGFYLTPNEAEAASYAEMAEGDEFDEDDNRGPGQILKTRFLSRNPATFETTADYYKWLQDDFGLATLGNYDTNEWALAVSEALRSRGHDGVLLKDYDYIVALDGRQVATTNVRSLAQFEDGDEVTTPEDIQDENLRRTFEEARAAQPEGGQEPPPAPEQEPEEPAPPPEPEPEPEPEPTPEPQFQPSPTKLPRGENERAAVEAGYRRYGQELDAVRNASEQYRAERQEAERNIQKLRDRLASQQAAGKRTTRTINQLQDAEDLFAQNFGLSNRRLEELLRPASRRLRASIFERSGMSEEQAMALRNENLEIHWDEVEDAFPGTWSRDVLEGTIDEVIQATNGLAATHRLDDIGVSLNRDGSPSGRASYDDSYKSIGIGNQNRRSVIWHEMFHQFEYSSRTITQGTRLTSASKEFLDRRGREHQGLGPNDEVPVESIDAIDARAAGRDIPTNRPDDEIGIDGGFITAYTGRIYPGDLATEVLTTGIENFDRATSMAQLAASDFEHFEYTVGALTLIQEGQFAENPDT